MINDPFQNYYTGTSGLLLPVPNKEYYPVAFKDKSRLHYYGSLFNSIEINSSFYKMPMASTVAKWAADVPDHFKFTFKLLRDVTHAKGLIFDASLVTEFLRRISEVGQKKGTLLVQFPGGITTAHTRQVEQLLCTIKTEMTKSPWEVAVEFRQQHWYNDDTYELLDKYEAGLVLHDKLSEGGMFIESSKNFIYLRFHGPGGNYKGSYSEDLLHEYASYIREWLIQGKEVYSYFNNTMGSAIDNLRTLRMMILEER